MRFSPVWLVASSLTVSVCQTTSSASSLLSSTDAASTNGEVTPTQTITGSGDASVSTSDLPGTSDNGGGSPAPTTPSSTPPADVVLHVPELSVGKIELDVDNLQAEINLAAQVANLVELNAGVQLGVKKVNITIADVEAELDLVIRLGHLTTVVNRTLHSLNLNPLLLNVLDTVSEVAGDVVGAVDGLLGSITQGGSKINFLIDNLGNIVQEATGSAGDVVSSIVGNFKTNMTYTGSEQQLGNGLTRRTYEYEALGTLVNIITNAVDQVVQAVVVKGGDDGGAGSGNSGGNTSAATTTAPQTTLSATG